MVAKVEGMEGWKRRGGRVVLFCSSLTGLVYSSGSNCLGC